MNDPKYQCNKDAGGHFVKVLWSCLLLIDITASLKIFYNSVIISTKKNMIPIPLLVFRLVQAFGTAKGFVDLITK